MERIHLWQISVGIICHIMLRYCNIIQMVFKRLCVEYRKANVVVDVLFDTL